MDNKKYVIDVDEVNVIPGINNVISENSEGLTKKFNILCNRNQNATTIIIKPDIKLIFANTFVINFVFDNIFVKID